MKRQDYDRMAAAAVRAFEKAGIAITEEERGRIEVADFGLGRVDKVGLQILTYVNTQRVCAKEMYLAPHQACPEHKHVPSAVAEGKEETFRVRYGRVHLYVDGEWDAGEIPLPETKVTVFKEIILNPGEQYTLMPETLHWFRAGEEGAVISEFSTRSTDETDLFTDEDITRAPKIED